MAEKQNSNPVGDFLLKYWPIIIAVLGLSGAWGATQVKINSLEEAVKSNAETQQQVADLKANAAAIDQRTKDIQDAQKAMQDSQVQQQQILQQILLRLPKGH